jgi:hydrogenase nickel incorporation protein HypA/HybF
MHELGITENIIAIALEQAKGAKIRRLTLEIGQLSAIAPESIQFCFDVCSQGTMLEGATLEIIFIAGRGVCQDCGEQIPMELPFALCSGCGSRQIKITQGQELTLKTLEIESIAILNEI